MSSVQPNPAGNAFASLRILALTLVGSLPIVFVVIAIALGDQAFGAEQPPVWVHAVLVALVFAGYLAGLTAVRTVRPMDPRASGAQPLRPALAAYQTTMFLRFALAEAPVILLIALAFALDHGLWIAVVAGPIGIILVALAVLPTQGNLRRVQDRLEADGARTGLVEASRGRLL